MRINGQNKWVSSGWGVGVLLLALGVAGYPPGKAVSQPPSEKPSAEACLQCHGPFKDLMKRTAGYVTAQGAKVNPHLNVPHKSDKVSVCNECHGIHALPMPASGSVVKANIQYCYLACHHEQDFTPCGKCHKDQK